MITYNSNNIFVGQIKELLKSYNLPSCKVLVSGDKIRVFEGCTYIYDNMLLVALQDNDYTTSGFTYNQSVFRFVDYYKEDLPILNITHSTTMNTNYYDERTHRDLGNYLRFQRDYNSINLMPMYNCFSGNVARNFSIEINKKTYNADSKDYKLYVVPVKLWKDYKIHFDCLTCIEAFVTLYKEGNLLSVKTSDNIDVITTLANLTYEKIKGVRFSSYYLYSKLHNLQTSDEILKLVYANENNLCLILKVPFYSTSSLVVIEDYCVNDERANATLGTLSNRTYSSIDGNSHITKTIINWDRDKDTANTSITNIRNTFLDNNDEYITQGQLTRMNDQLQHPFASRLIEYLVQQTIDPRDTLTMNIKLVEKSLCEKGLLENYTTSYLWEKKLQNIIYLSSQEHTPKNSTLSINDRAYDLYGYVDKDVEGFVMGNHRYPEELEG